MKKITGLIMIWTIGLVFAAGPAFAGAKQHYRWEGVAIGLGAAILGHALYESAKNSSSEHVSVYSRPCPPPYRQGHWEVRRVWVTPVYQKVWNPGHYNGRGTWVPGQWQMIEKNAGYWQEQEIWVAGR